MAGRPRLLSFGWWNLHDFAHYDSAKRSLKRWPKRRIDYEAKKNLTLDALEEIFGNDFPDLLAVCEITREASEDLVASLPRGYAVAFPPVVPRGEGFQVAVFYRPANGFTPELPLIPSEKEDVTVETRAMIAVHFSIPGHVIRFIACHWTAFDTPTSRISRERLADFLRRDVYEFLQPEVPPINLVRHVVVLGDLNEEPMSPIFEERLIGTRDRTSSRREHWRDEQVRRIHLYNAAWRYLGEQAAHGATQSMAGAAGTYYNDRPNGWRTLDHLLVSGGLLGAVPPYLDEANTGIRLTPAMQNADGLPVPFDPGTVCGVSDHVPIIGCLVLPEVSK